MCGKHLWEMLWRCWWPHQCFNAFPPISRSFWLLHFQRVFAAVATTLLAFCRRRPFRSCSLTLRIRAQITGNHNCTFVTVVDQLHAMHFPVAFFHMVHIKSCSHFEDCNIGMANPGCKKVLVIINFVVVEREVGSWFDQVWNIELNIFRRISFLKCELHMAFTWDNFLAS